MDNATELFGKRIRELRKLRGLSQDDLGAKIGIDQKHMSRIELGKSYPSLDRLIQISDALEVDLPALFVFGHLDTNAKRTKRIEEMIQRMDEGDQQRMYKIAKTFLDG
jgi:transcriptional regulator with XRE-family HTH domain